MAEDRGPVELQHPTSINDLPADVLLIIFRDVLHDAPPRPWKSSYVETRVGCKAQLDPWPSFVSRATKERVQEHIDHEKPASELLAAVHPYWREVMSNLSEFWKSFVIWTGRNPTPLSHVRQYLAWSKMHAVDIFVYRRYDPSLHDPTEKARMRAICELLIPHIKRIRVLSVHCVHSSSLPRPHFDLCGQADILRKLVLDSMIDDMVVDSAPLHSLDTPVLQHLSIKGVHFRESYVLRPSQLMGLESISISDYGIHNVAFSVADFVAWITHCDSKGRPLCKVTLDNLHLDYHNDSPPVAGLRYCPSMHFVNMSGDAIAECARLLDYPKVDTLMCTACTAPIGGFTRSAMFSPSRVALEQFTDEDTLLAYVADHLDLFSCKNLRFKDCTALTPRVLQKLAAPALPVQDDCRALWYFPNVWDLTIMNCPQVRSTDLRAMVQARHDMHMEMVDEDYDDPQWAVAMVEYLYVSGCCELMPADKEWFERHAYVHTYWDKWYRGSMF